MAGQPRKASCYPPSAHGQKDAGLQNPTRWGGAFGSPLGQGQVWELGVLGSSQPSVMLPSWQSHNAM